MNNTQPFYAISYCRSGWPDGPWYVSKAGGGTQDVSQAKRYGSLSQAVADAAITTWNLLPEFALVKVTPVEVGTKAKLVSKTKIDATKPVVLFNVKLQQYGQKRPDGMLLGVTDIADATIFTDLADAMIANLTAVNAAITKYNGTFDMMKLDIVHVHQVEVLPASIEYTTEVLS